MGSIEWGEFKFLHRALCEFRARFKTLKTPGYFQTVEPKVLGDFLKKELSELKHYSAGVEVTYHSLPDTLEIITVSIDNFMNSMGPRPVTEARFMRLMTRIKAAMLAHTKEHWKLAGATHCPLCALKLVSYCI